MTKSQRSSLIVLLLFLVITLAIGWMAYRQTRLVSDENQVYSAFFRSQLKALEFRHIVALSKPSVCKAETADYKGLPKDVVRSFDQANKAGARPIRLSVLGGRVPTVRWDDTKRINKEGMGGFQRPPGYRMLLLSRVGFNADHSAAIGCVEISDPGFGEGLLIYLKKTTKGWRPAEIRRIWIS